ncbi:MAG TPA: hypothetical protein VJR71_16320 [Pseudolabrys sp.]|nr:hypothetical protein [Pseudolabrys sp.]
MFRKLTLALGATVAITAAALMPTSASAHMHGHFHGHGHWGWGLGIYAPTYVASDCYYVKQLVNTPAGPRVRRVAVCD